jgi:uncharacterized protein YuzE
MHMTYDPSVDALTIVFKAQRRAYRTDEVRPGVLFDLDSKGRLLAIELLDASGQVSKAVLDRIPLPKPMMPLADAAERVSLAPATLRQQIRNKRLTAVKWRREWWIDERELAAYLERRAPQGRRSARASRTVTA